VQRETVEQVRTAFATLSSSQANLERLTAELIPLLERRRSDVERAYEARDVDVTFLLRADQALRESRARVIDLERQASSALYALQHTVGGPAAFDRALAVGEGAGSDD
jgi:outer membrane protein TolC